MREHEQMVSPNISVDDASPTFAQGREPTKQERLIERDRNAELTPTNAAAGEVLKSTPSDKRIGTDADRVQQREDSPLT